MTRQLTILDMVEQVSTYPDINDITESEMAKLVGNALGLNFKYNQDFERYEANIPTRKRSQKPKISVSFRNYAMDDNHDRFLSAGYTYNLGGGGGGYPTIEKALEYLEKRVDEFRS